MATFVNIGARLVYTDDHGHTIRFVVAHIIDYCALGTSTVKLTTTKDSTRLQLNDTAAVTTALALLDSLF